MTISPVLVLNPVILAGPLLVLWLVSLLRRNASIIDLFWGCGFVVIAWTSFLAAGRPDPQAILATILVSLWGLRLSAYLTWRNWGKGEDFRYKAMRKHHGRRFPIVSLFTVFGLQGLLMWIIAIPLQVGIGSRDHMPWSVAVLGIVLWTIGFLFESIGDYQLARFKADPANRGRVMKRGLWQYTRHPNYFGDFLVWWGLFAITAEPNSWWWTILGPLLMSFLLIRVSGVRLLESSLRGRVAGYEQYLQETSSFFPWPPRRAALPD